MPLRQKQRRLLKNYCGAELNRRWIGFVWGAQGGSSPQDRFAVANLSFSAALPKSSSKAPNRSVLVKR